jgi:hypothetical protein
MLLGAWSQEAATMPCQTGCFPRLLSFRKQEAHLVVTAAMYLEWPPVVLDLHCQLEALCNPVAQVVMMPPAPLPSHKQGSGI